MLAAEIDERGNVYIMTAQKKWRLLPRNLPIVLKIIYLELWASIYCDTVKLKLCSWKV